MPQRDAIFVRTSLSGGLASVIARTLVSPLSVLQLNSQIPPAIAEKGGHVRRRGGPREAVRHSWALVKDVHAVTGVRGMQTHIL